MVERFALKDIRSFIEVGWPRPREVRCSVR